MMLIFKTNRTVGFILAVLAICLFIHSTAAAREPFKVTTVILVRHAEKQTSPPADPPLTDAGKTRSQNLSRLLAKAGITAIITSQFLRTKQTAEPLASNLGIEPAVIPIAPDPADRNKVSQQAINNIVGKIQQHAGETVVVVGHTNTLPEVIAKLGGGVIPAIPETEYDNLFIVTLYEKGKAKVIRLKY